MKHERYGCAIAELEMEVTLRKESRWPLEAENSPQLIASKGMGTHSSNCKELNSAIASINLGMDPSPELPNKSAAWQTT